MAKIYSKLNNCLISCNSVALIFKHVFCGSILRGTRWEPHCASLSTEKMAVLDLTQLTVYDSSLSHLKSWTQISHGIIMLHFMFYAGILSLQINSFQHSFMLIIVTLSMPYYRGDDNGDGALTYGKGGGWAGLLDSQQGQQKISKLELSKEFTSFHFLLKNLFSRLILLVTGRKKNQS